MAFEKNPIIGRMRWKCSIATRSVKPLNANSQVQTDQYTNIRLVYADIQPVSTFTFFNSKQIDNEITHKFYIRYQDVISMFDVILRNTINPDGTSVQELFHIKRIAPIDGRKRFMVLDCVQETKDTR
jgi:head-tail adaptor